MRLQVELTSSLFTPAVGAHHFYVFQVWRARPQPLRDPPRHLLAHFLCHHWLSPPPANASCTWIQVGGGQPGVSKPVSVSRPMRWKKWAQIFAFLWNVFFNFLHFKTRCEPKLGFSFRGQMRPPAWEWNNLLGWTANPVAAPALPVDSALNLFLFAGMTNVLALADLYKEPIDGLSVDRVVQEITHKDMCRGGLQIPQTWMLLLSPTAACSPVIRRAWGSSITAAASSSSPRTAPLKRTFTPHCNHCGAVALSAPPSDRMNSFLLPRRDQPRGFCS